MTADVIKIPVPKTAITFDIGGKKFTVSLADKSRAMINAAYQKIEAEEVANNQHMDDLRAELTEALGNIDGTLSDAEATKERNRIDNRYEKKFNAADEKAEKIAKTDYLPFLDVLFGEGSGQQIYDICGQSIIAVNKVIGLVMVQINQADDVSDYMAKYAASIDEMKKQAESAGGANGLNGTDK